MAPTFPHFFTFFFWTFRLTFDPWHPPLFGCWPLKDARSPASLWFRSSTSSLARRSRPLPRFRRRESSNVFLSWRRHKGFMAKYWRYLGNNRQISWRYLGYILQISLRYLRFGKKKIRTSCVVVVHGSLGVMMSPHHWVKGLWKPAKKASSETWARCISHSSWLWILRPWKFQQFQKGNCLLQLQQRIRQWHVWISALRICIVPDLKLETEPTTNEQHQWTAYSMRHQICTVSENKTQSMYSIYLGIYVSVNLYDVYTHALFLQGIIYY